MLYFLQVTIYTALMYAAYLLLLKNKTGHSFNRMYLRACAIIPVFIPFLNFPLFAGAVNVPAVVALPAIHIADRAGAVMTGEHNYGSLQSIVYRIGLLMLVLLLGWQYERMKKMVAGYKPVKMDGSFIITNTGYGPGSFRRFIFFPGGEIDEVILKHEQAHVHLKHGPEILLLRLWQCFFWPDIMLFAIIREMKMVHEFQADEYTANGDPGYATTLLNEVFQTKQFALTHTYFQHPIKRRIMMLQKKQTGRSAYIAAICLSALLIVTAACAQKAVKGPKDAYPAASVTNTSVDKMPEPNYSITDFIAQNLVYPVAARKDGIQGRVIVKFLVDKDGNITSPAILRTPAPVLSDAALAVVAKMPPWAPGEKDGKKVAVYYTLPISFQLSQ